MDQLQKTLEAVRTARQSPLPHDPSDPINKAFTQATGLVNYDLEGPAKLLYPVLTPLRNRIPRVKANGGTATNWKQVTAVNISKIRFGVSEGNRNAVIVDAVADKVAAYKGFGLENNVTFEADDASQGYDDAKALAVLNLLNATMLQEEAALLGGNNSLTLGTTPTPTVATSTTGGTLAAQTWSIICVALTPIAFREATIAGGLTVTAVRTNADGSTDSVKGGHAAKSAAATQATTGATSTIDATITPVNGAVAYAWFYGLAGSEVLGVITTLNTVRITAAATGTQNASVLTGDQSTDTLTFDGILTQCFTPGSGAYNQSLPTVAGVGTPLTSDGAGGVTEIDTALMAFWDNFRLTPDEIYVSATTLLAINKLIIANSGAPLIRYTLDGGGGSAIEAGTVIGSYLNKPMNKKVKITVHPDMPSGMILFYSSTIPYPLSNVNNILQVKTRREYYQIEWPLRSRKYEFGVYGDELLQNYFPAAFGLLRNIKV